MASYVEEQYIQALEKENAELKRQLDEQRLKETSDAHSYCHVTDYGNAHNHKVSYEEQCLEHLNQAHELGFDPLIGFPAPESWEQEEWEPEKKADVVDQENKKEPCVGTARNNYQPIEEAVMDIMASYGIPLINFKDTLTMVIKNVTENSNYYLNNQIWNSKNIFMFERIYGIKPFSPGSFDCTGMVVCDKDGKIIPHKKIIIGHLGEQEITIDVLDRKEMIPETK